MATYEQILRKIQSSVTKFNEKIPDSQKAMFEAIQGELRRLDLNGTTIKATVQNLKILASIKSKLNRIVLSDDYVDELKTFVKSFNEITKLQNDYWKGIEPTFKPRPLLREIRKQAIGDTVTKLGEAGIGANISDKITDILRTNITTGGSIAKLESQLRESLTDTQKSDGILSKYTKQITTDAVNQYNAQYTQTVSSDLGYEWFAYQGSELTTSRPFCQSMIEEIKFFHISEVPDLLKADDMHYTDNFTQERQKVKIYKKTGLPEGMIEGTNPDNFFIRRGGYNCGHQIRPVSEKFVPAEAKFRANVTGLTTTAKSQGKLVDTMANDIAAKHGATVTPINFKSKGSIARKANDDYNGDITKVQDAVRNTIIVPKSGIAGVIADLQKDPLTTRVKIQDPNKDPLGYSGAIANVKTRAGINGEIQVNTAEMIYAKERKEDALRIIGQDKWDEINKKSGLPGGQGHEIYEIWRKIDKTNPDNIPKLRELEKKSTEYYSNFR